MLRSLQASRAGAAVGVALFHMSTLMALPRFGGDTSFLAVMDFGRRGVDFFFVLSGFIILLAHHRDIDHPGAWRSYAYRRFVRLFPIYWVYTAGFLLSIHLLPDVQPSPLKGVADWLTTLTLIKWNAVNPPLGQAWTLFHEIAFYSVFSLLIVSRRVGIVAFTLFAGVALWAFQYPDPEARSALAVYSAAYNLNFLLGMAAYWLSRRPGNGWLELLCGIACVAASGLDSPAFHPFAALVAATGFALLIAGITKLDRAGSVRLPAALAFLGDASYSIYLIHENVEIIAMKLSMKMHLHAHLNIVVLYILVVAVAVGAGCLAYVCLERPILNRLRSQHGASRKGAALG